MQMNIRILSFFLCAWISSIVAADQLLSPLEPADAETSAGWVKHDGNPVLGGQYGTCFDISVLKEGDKYRMWVSWRPKASIALTESSDGIQWSEPRIALGPCKETGWEDDINRPAVVKRADGYHLWYTGQTKDRSSIGYATSSDGITWKRKSDKPVLLPEKPWEKVAVMCPHVLWDQQANQFRMWYSGGEQNEPNAIGYATSSDGLIWTKHEANPIFVPEPKNEWEKHKVTACQVIRQGQWHVMFYIGFRDVHHAQIGVARSRDGLGAWERHPANPMLMDGYKSRDPMVMLHPVAQLVQRLRVSLRNHTRIWNRKSFDVSAPTGQISTVFSV